MSKNNYWKVVSRRRDPNDKERVLVVVSFDDTNEDEIRRTWNAAVTARDVDISNRKIVAGRPVRILGPWNAAPVTWHCAIAER